MQLHQTFSLTRLLFKPFSLNLHTLGLNVCILLSLNTCAAEALLLPHCQQEIERTERCLPQMAAFQAMSLQRSGQSSHTTFPFGINGTNKRVNCPSPQVPYSNVLAVWTLLLYILGFSWRGSLGWGKGHCQAQKIWDKSLEI